MLVNKLICWTIIFAMAFPMQLCSVWANTDVERAMEESSAIEKKVTQGLGNEVDLGLEDLIVDDNDSNDDDNDDGGDNNDDTGNDDSGDNNDDNGNDDSDNDNGNESTTPPVTAPSDFANIYKCLVDSFQYKGMPAIWNFGTIQSSPYNGDKLEEKNRIWHRVLIEFDNGKMDYDIFGQCQAILSTIETFQFNKLFQDLQTDLDSQVNHMVSDTFAVVAAYNRDGMHDKFEKRNKPKLITYRPSKLYSNAEPMYKLIDAFADKAGAKSSDKNPNALKKLKEMPSEFSMWGSAWMMALQILISQAHKTEHDHVKEVIEQQTHVETSNSADARDEAAEAEKKQKRKEMWGNILKVGLAVGGGILAWKLIDNLNSDNEDEDDDDRFDGPIMPPPPPPWMMQPPYGGYPGGYPGQYPQQPYPPGPQYPQQPPVVPQPPPQQGPNFGRLLVDIKSKLQSIITLQRQLITQYINRTNSNMTESDKDNFRRTVAQIDGLVREVNPMIQMMENTPIPGNPNDLGTINGLHREVRQMIGEVEQNARQIQQFMGQMNLQGTGFAGPASAGTSPNLPVAPPPTAQPWNNANIQAAINKCLQEHNPPLNQWGFPENPNIKQGMPPGAAGMSSFQYVWNNPRIRTCAQKG